MSSSAPVSNVLSGYRKMQSQKRKQYEKVEVFAIINLLLFGISFFCFNLLSILTCLIFSIQKRVINTSLTENEILILGIFLFFFLVASFITTIQYLAAGIGLHNGKSWGYTCHITGAFLSIFTIIGAVYGIVALAMTFNADFKSSIVSTDESVNTKKQLYAGLWRLIYSVFTVGIVSYTFAPIFVAALSIVGNIPFFISLIIGMMAGTAWLPLGLIFGLIGLCFGIKNKRDILSGIVASIYSVCSGIFIILVAVFSFLIFFAPTSTESIDNRFELFNDFGSGFIFQIGFWVIITGSCVIGASITSFSNSVKKSLIIHSALMITSICILISMYAMVDISNKLFLKGLYYSAISTITDVDEAPINPRLCEEAERKAFQYFTKAIYSNNKHYLTYDFVKYLADMKDKHNHLLAWFAELERTGKVGWCHYMTLGRICYYSIGDRFCAEKAFRKAFELEPQFARTQNLYAFILTDLNKNLSMAEDLIQSAISKKPDNIAFIDTYAWFLYRKGHVSKAIAELNRAIKQNPRKSELYYHFGVIAYEQGDLKKAVQYFSKAKDSGLDPYYQYRVATILGSNEEIWIDSDDSGTIQLNLKSITMTNASSENIGEQMCASLKKENIKRSLQKINGIVLKEYNTFANIDTQVISLTYKVDSFKSLSFLQHEKIDIGLSNPINIKKTEMGRYVFSRTVLNPAIKTEREFGHNYDRAPKLLSGECKRRQLNGKKFWYSIIHFPGKVISANTPKKYIDTETNTVKWFCYRESHSDTLQNMTATFEQPEKRIPFLSLFIFACICGMVVFTYILQRKTSGN
ncbi:MAG: tetratricopeptide repeat protein [Desulfobacterales bacterium]|nr:tetratricopeptide repeat protein [Desulfobacterales bacterium]